METRDELLYLGSVCAAVCLFLWTIYMVKKHCSGKTPAEKCKKYEKMMLKPVMMFVIAFVVPIGVAVISVAAMCTNEPFSELGAIFAVALPLCVFFTLWASRWNMAYTYDYIRYQPVFGKMRTYSYADVKFMLQIGFDLLVHVGNRWILIDFTQDWTGLLEYYRLWQDQNGKGRKKREPKTKLGKVMRSQYMKGMISGIVIVFGGVNAGFIWLVCSTIKNGTFTMVPIICFAVLDVIMLFVIVFSIFVAANEDKYPKLAEKWLGKKENRGRKRK